MYYPTFEQFKTIAKSDRFIPISREIFSDMENPIRLFHQYAAQSGSFLLESVEGGEKWARYSFLGRKPCMTITAAKGITSIEHDGDTIERTGNPLTILKEIMSDYRGVAVPGLPRFTGGAVGYFGYDMVRYFEHLPMMPPDDTGFPDLCMMVFEEVIAFDHLKQRVLVIIHVRVEKDVAAAYAEVVRRLDAIAEEVLYAAPHAALIRSLRETKTGVPICESSITESAFIEAVERAKTHIRDGDIFQVVLSRRLTAEYPGDPFNVYRCLRVLNPSPYMYFLNFKDFTVAGASPELLIRVEGDHVETCPIAGTRPRGASPDADDALALELLRDEKELAEHIMLVDLGRNDIGKVAAYGSVRIENPMHIEKYSHVMHIVTNVTGTLRKDADCFDALAAVLPAGTLSGAPKIRAMEIIDGLEPVRRGLYGGAIGYIGFDGNMDTCITIRTLVFKDSRVYIQTGAGIVADSVPEREYQEISNKAGAMLKALGEAGALA